MEYQLDKRKRQDWRKDTRYYSCQVLQNLFEQWVVLRRWGRVSALQGQSIEVVCNRYKECVETFEAVERWQEGRGYYTW